MTDLSSLRALCEKATPAPWQTEGDDTVVIDNSGDYVCGDPDSYMGEADARFIVAARNALPLLVAELEAARAVVEAARVLLEDVVVFDDAQDALAASLDEYAIRAAGSDAEGGV